MAKKRAFVQTLVNFLRGGGSLYEAFALTPENQSFVLGQLRKLTQESSRKRFPSLGTEAINFLLLKDDIKHKDVRTLYKGVIPFIEVIAKVESKVAYVVIRLHFLNGNYFDVVKVMRDADLWANTYVDLENTDQHANIGNLYDDLTELGIYEDVCNGLANQLKLPA